MAKNEKMYEDDAVEAKAPTPVTPKITVQTSKAKVFSFEQWAKLRGKPERHMRGMKAFLGVRAGYKYPLEQWDEIFGSY